MSSPGPPPSRWRDVLSIVGPGIVVAATGVGAGDLVAAAKAGSELGLAVLWAALAGAALKLALNEGVARWQLATGTTLLEGWVETFGWPIRLYFLAYLLLWTVIVSAALMSACGLAAHALVPAVPVAAWGVIHALAALLLVWFEGYAAVERVMKWAVGLMFVAIVGTAALNLHRPAAVLAGALLPSLPAGSTVLVAGVIGGVGGSLTLLSYGYWIREKGWSGPSWIRAVRADLGVAYLLTGAFGFALILLGAAVLRPAHVAVAGNEGALRMAAMLGDRFGAAGRLVFLTGFWAAVATSIVGVWQGVPYLFADYAAQLRRRRGRDAGPAVVSTRGRWYRGYLLFMTFPPMALLLVGRPVWIVLAYAAVGALFMPFLAGTLLVLNNRRRLGSLANGIAANAVLVACLLLFAWLAVVELAARLGG